MPIAKWDCFTFNCFECTGVWSSILAFSLPQIYHNVEIMIIQRTCYTTVQPATQNRVTCAEAMGNLMLQVCNSYLCIRAGLVRLSRFAKKVCATLWFHLPKSGATLGGCPAPASPCYASHGREWRKWTKSSQPNMIWISTLCSSLLVVFYSFIHTTCIYSPFCICAFHRLIFLPFWLLLSMIR